MKKLEQLIAHLHDQAEERRGTWVIPAGKRAAFYHFWMQHTTDPVPAVLKRCDFLRVVWWKAPQLWVRLTANRIYCAHPARAPWLSAQNAVAAIVGTLLVYWVADNTTLTGVAGFVLQGLKVVGILMLAAMGIIALSAIIRFAFNAAVTNMQRRLITTYLLHRHTGPSKSPGRLWFLAVPRARAASFKLQLKQLVVAWFDRQTAPACPTVVITKGD